jgi:hypothetical protein
VETTGEWWFAVEEARVVAAVSKKPDKPDGK